MTQLTDFTKFPLRIRTPDFVMSSSEAGPPFSLQGHDKKGRTWHLSLPDASRSAWRSEAGQRTYYFTAYTGATGSGPATRLFALSFDSLGRPIPFVIATHGTIADVLDLDGTGPEILQQDYQGNIRDDPGYYVTTLYLRRGDYWYRSDGRHGAHVFPTSEKWSVMAQDKPAVLTVPPVFKRAVLDASNDPNSGSPAEIIGLAENNTLHVKSGLECGIVVPNVLVQDSPRGRDVALKASEQSLKGMAESGSHLVLTGVYHFSDRKSCSASIIWATSAR